MDIFNPTLIAIIVFGIINSYTDIKDGKIKNIVIVAMLFTGLMFNIFVNQTLSSVSFHFKPVYIETISNFLIALITGFLIYIAGLWTAGDAKLFLAFSFLLPVTAYKISYVAYFPSFTILVNTFVPVTLVFLIKSLPYLKKSKNLIKKYFSLSSLSEVVLLIFGFSFIINLILSPFKINLDILSYTIVLIFLMEIFKRYVPIPLRASCAILSALRIIFYYNSITKISFVENLLITVLLFQTMRFFASILEPSFTKVVKIKDLKDGMTLSEHLVEMKDSYVKEDFSIVTLFGLIDSFKKGFLENTSTRLTKEQIGQLKKLSKEKKLKFQTIKVAKTIPFAPIMFLGVLLAYLLQGNFLYYLVVASSYLYLYAQIGYLNIIKFFGLM